MSTNDRTVLAAVASHAMSIARVRALDPHGVEHFLGTPAQSSGSDAAATPDDLGPLLESYRRDAQWRKRTGTYFTSSALVAPTVARTLEPLLARGWPSVCDPAAGGGAFLLEAYRALVAAGASPRVAVESLTGVDVDPLAARVARVSLWLESGVEPEIVASRVHCADALTERSARGEFDAVVGNPPWDIHKPDSRRFFAEFDPEFAWLTKQEAIRAQRRLLEDPEIAARWQRALDEHRAFARRLREPDSGFEHQGRGDPNRYKLFTELAWHLLRPGGRLGLLLPSGIYSDAGAEPLRRLLLEGARWEWLFGFENRRGLFPIDSRYKFAAIVAEKGGSTRAIRTAFLRRDPGDWVDAERHATALPTALIRAASPFSLAIPELRDREEARILEHIEAASRPLAEEFEHGLRYRRELDQTTDAHRFAARSEWEARDFRATPCGSWVHPDGRRALPVWEGRMIGQFDFSEKGWVRGGGRRAEWRPLPFEDKPIEPQFLIDAAELGAVDPDHAHPKIGFMAIASATNARSMIAASLIDAPCGNSVPTLRGPCVRDDLVVLAVLNSLVYDFALRTRLAGTNLNRFVLAETPMLRPELRRELADLAGDVAALCWIHPRYERAWRLLGASPDPATDERDRLERRATIDARIALAFGLGEAEFARICRDCTHPTDALRKPRFTRALDPKGFWRVDREREPDDRLPVRALARFR